MNPDVLRDLELYSMNSHIQHLDTNKQFALELTAN